MIDEKILDEILPVPDREELKNSIEEELRREGFIITNFSSGGVFYTLLMILLQIRIELVKLMRVIVNNIFVSHAQGVWMELKAADFSKKRKQPTKAKGYVTIKRDISGEAVKIAKGDVFKTEQDINGEELRFLVLEESILQKDSLSQNVLVEAEKEGSKYNVSQGQIKKSLTHIEGIDRIANEADWLIKEGSDLEDIESLRERTLNSWAELSTYPIRDKYKNVCESVEGVLFVRVDDMHPRGQGTVDIIVTSTAGAATEGLLANVEAKANTIKGPYDNLLIKSSETAQQDIQLVLYIAEDASDEGVKERAEAIIIDLLKIKKGRELNKLYKDDIVFSLKKDIQVYKKANIISPEDDIILSNDKVIVLGSLDITVERV
ncbi:baseplate J/gp47 family protein [Tissierella carlieri]|uniref:baseplate J/gp47 family protein n=1 Tax=Tissierella carlieri TaxID=689904 RepID=UPI001C0FCF66|nr:baseplate J/gp47 family protein [Tissierella carlieri]MBU5312212.1 baseplate J/gp47 family protein [Tissierella carlieri]